MVREAFQPVPVESPAKNPLLFWIRCCVDLQLNTITKYLRPALAELKGHVLDVGAGESPWREWLSGSCQYQGIDVSDSNEYGMSANRPDILYYDGKTIPFPMATFDGAICIEVLEHIAEPDDFVAEIARVLKDGAVLLLSVPWSARRHHIPHDYHRFSRERLEILLSQHGFHEINIRERGNDVVVISNKLIVLVIRLLRPSRNFDAIWSVPLAAIAIPFAMAMLLAAHASDALGRGAKEDPLGYFVRAVRSSSK